MKYHLNKRITLTKEQRIYFLTIGSYKTTNKPNTKQLD